MDYPFKLQPSVKHNVSTQGKAHSLHPATSLQWHRALFLLLFLLAPTVSFCQPEIINLASYAEKGKMEVHQRTLTHSSAGEGEVYLDARDSDGLAIPEGVKFTTGRIKVKIKGENNPGKSFVGIAFNIVSADEYEAVYFRPFNFVATEPLRQSHMVQYIHHPEFTWRKLRESRTGEFENIIEPAPDPDDWFTAEIEVTESTVVVYVNEDNTPALTVDRLGSSASDRIGIFTGFGSKGAFKEFTLTKSN